MKRLIKNAERYLGLGLEIEMSIKIGDNNTIKNSIFSNTTASSPDKKKNWAEKHPILISLVISLIAGLILMFSFWGSIIKYVERIF